ncbi:hypothetical protein [Okeania sp.]|uniref:hypothetical protein n=1 Tax=Okeania sp. TaxID=3100323 RepID=UPI002B4B0A11|nr:hypothetical protein [Okeania sp.]MEB3342234.1 hypothetical protein [Okeania sp.]
MIQTTIFRANQKYKLVPYENLTPNEQNNLSQLREDPDFFGVLLPNENSGLTIKAICHQTAKLYQNLHHPGKIPKEIISSLGENTNTTIEKLLLDSILELQTENGFVSGAEAYSILEPEKYSPNNGSKLAQLSMKAIEYAEKLNITDVTKLSARLYFYNRLPLTPKRHQAFSTPEYLVKYLHLHPDGKHYHLLEKHWEPVKVTNKYGDYWSLWRSRHDQTPTDKKQWRYKLYVSTNIEFQKEILGEVIAILSDTETRSLKFAKKISGLLRPDNFIAYFYTLENLQNTAEKLASALTNIPAQGVPFTAEITSGGLLSWGIDPPQDKYQPNWQEKESWRLWITNRLASAIIAAKSNKNTDLEPRIFALKRLSLEGIDTTNWIPSIVNIQP